VLVVEDEPMVRFVAVTALEDAGFTVAEAGDAAEALSMLAEYAGAVHVVFTDIQMPGAVDGLALARLVRERWPDVAVILASGRAFPLRTDLPPGSAFLSKPYNLSDVVARVRAVAGGP
jgi:CheY-like chemotaxis protein